MVGALGTHGKRQGVQVGATNRMLAVLVDQNHAVEKREGILRGPLGVVLGSRGGILEALGRVLALFACLGSTSIGVSMQTNEFQETR